MNVEGGLQLTDLRGAVRRRGKLAALTALLFFLASYWLAMALPNIFTSYATVLVEPQAVAEDLVRAGVQDSDLNQRLHLMTAQILSRPRLSRIIDEFDLYPEESEYMLRDEIIDLMRSRVRVDPVVPELEQAVQRHRELVINEFQIVFDDYDSETAMNVAQKLANDFIESHIDARVQTSQKSLDFIQGELDRLAQRIAVVEADIARVKNENPGSLPEDFLASQRRLERVLGDMAQAQRIHAEVMSDQAFYKSQLASASAYGTPNDEASPVRRLELLKLDLAEHKSRGFTEKHPDVVKTRAEIEELEAAVDALEESGEDEMLAGSPLLQQTQAQARRAALRGEAVEKEIERLRGLAETIEASISATPAVAEQLDALNREYEHLFGSFQDFSTRHLEATVQAQLERRQLGEQFRVLEAAFEAFEPSAPNRALILLLGALFGIAVGAGVGLVMETTDTSAHDARQLQTRLQLPVLALIPRIWLESDRFELRRRRLREVMATASLVTFALVGGAINYLWVNGVPGFIEAAFSAEEDAGGSAGGQVRDADAAGGG
jgi:polysaccharide chain length determinant protein (PEP-CTERM system associated)